MKQSTQAQAAHARVATRYTHSYAEWPYWSIFPRLKNKIQNWV